MINIYGSSMEKHVRTKILLEGLKCYKHTQVKGYNITKLAAELKYSDNIP